MDKQHATIESALAEAHERIALATRQFKQSKREFNDAKFNAQIACRRSESNQTSLKACVNRSKQCAKNAVNNLRLEKRRSELQAELAALDDSARALEKTNQMIENRPDYEFEGTYVGRGRTKSFAVVIDDHDDGFRIRAKDTRSLDQNSVTTTHLLRQLDEPFRFCFDPTNRQTCGEAVVSEKDGFTFDEIKFKKT